MKKAILACLLFAFAMVAFGQTIVQPGGAIFDATTGSFIGFLNRNSGAEERTKLKWHVRTFQTTAPTCTTNCGTSPSVTGTDSAMLVTMGATGSPASAWVVTFDLAWAAAPTCIAQMALASMANTKLPIVVVTTATTLTVTTNGAAPANADKYFVQCVGVQ